MNNATRFINSWFISAGDSDLRRLILNEFQPFVSFMVESPKFPGIKITGFTDSSAIIYNKKEYIIASNGSEFVEAVLQIFHGNTFAVKRFFTECVSIIDTKRSDNAVTLTPAEHIKVDFNIEGCANEN